MIGGRHLEVCKAVNCYRSAIEIPSFQSISTNTFIQLMRQKRLENWLELSILTFPNEYFYFCPIGIAKISDSVFYNHHYKILSSYQRLQQIESGIAIANRQK